MKLLRGLCNNSKSTTYLEQRSHSSNQGSPFKNLTRQIPQSQDDKVQACIHMQGLSLKCLYNIVQLFLKHPILVPLLLYLLIPLQLVLMHAFYLQSFCVA